MQSHELDRSQLLLLHMKKLGTVGIVGGTGVYLLLKQLLLDQLLLLQLLLYNSLVLVLLKYC